VTASKNWTLNATAAARKNSMVAWLVSWRLRLHENSTR